MCGLTLPRKREGRSRSLPLWSRNAAARQRLALSERAAVNLLVNGSYEYSVQLVQDERGEWYESCSSSGHMRPADLKILATDEP